MQRTSVDERNDGRKIFAVESLMGYRENKERHWMIILNHSGLYPGGEVKHKSVWIVCAGSRAQGRMLARIPAGTYEATGWLNVAYCTTLDACDPKAIFSDRTPEVLHRQALQASL
ncbi:MAG: hypothetical protein ACLVEJ_06955 [Parabacteroides sp.]